MYADHAEGLLRFLVYRTGDRALAEDLVADTFERVLVSRHRFDPRKGSAKTWLYTIALNLLRDHARRAALATRTLERVGARGSWEEAEVERADERDALRRALRELSEEEREAVALRYGADLTVAEIARITRQSHSTTRGRVYRGLDKLRKELG